MESVIIWTGFESNFQKKWRGEAQNRFKWILASLRR